MAKTRSPGYPTIGLREAIEKIILVYEKDYQNRIPRELVAQHMGYRSLNGKSLGILSAVGKYGLLEGRGDDNRVSDLALQIIAHAPNTPERARALVEAAGRPDLFAELDTRFQGGRVSDAAIRSFLITQKFIPQAADITVRSYRETKELLVQETSQHRAEAQAWALDEGQAVRSGSEVDNEISREKGKIILSAEREYLRGPLSHKSAYRLLVSGPISGREIGKIIRILTLQKELIDDDNDE